MNNNIVPVKPSSIFNSTRISAPDSLRWLRRAVTLMLILSNYALTMWASSLR